MRGEAIPFSLCSRKIITCFRLSARKTRVFEYIITCMFNKLFKIMGSTIGVSVAGIKYLELLT